MTDTPIDLSASPITIAWNQSLRDRTTIPTLQVVVNPLLRRGSPIHDRAFAELARIGADYVRFVPWYPYPHDAIAELYPPENGKTSWNFTSIDPFVIDFLEATKGHPVMLNFSTIPPWMFKADHMVPYPDDPDQPIWRYQVGEELRDPSLKEMSEYFARLVNWYTNGGFTDELGVRHEAGHHYQVDYWEVLNEPDVEHNTRPEQYTQRYDAIVSAIRRDNPHMKFVGVAAALPGRCPEFFDHFLDPANHQPGIPLDMLSYHFYAFPAPDETLDNGEHTYFTHADGFINTVRYIETIRKRFSPSTQTTANEIGVIHGEDLLQFAPGHIAKPIPPVFWNMSGAVYAYVFAHLALLGIEIAGESQLVGYPSQFPSVSMVDWETGAPNARLRVLELLKTRLSPEDLWFRPLSQIPLAYPASSSTSRGSAAQMADARSSLSARGVPRLLSLSRVSPVLLSPSWIRTLRVVQSAKRRLPVTSSVSLASVLPLSRFKNTKWILGYNAEPRQEAFPCWGSVVQPDLDSSNGHATQCS